MLIGVGAILSMLCIGQFKPDNNDDLIAQKNKLGWVIAGNFNTPEKRKSLCFINNLNFNMEKFWELEEISPVTSKWSVDEQLCEDNFVQNVKRDNDGRSLPIIKEEDH